MRWWGLSAALASACWLGVLWPAVLLFVVAVTGWRRGRHWLVWLPLLWCYGVVQLHSGVAARLPESLEGETLSVQGQVVGLPATVKEFRFGRWRYRQTLTLDLWAAPAWPGRHRIRVNAYELPVRVKAGQRLALTVKLKAPRGVYNATGVDAARRDLASGIDARGTVKAWRVLDEVVGLDSWRQSGAERVAEQVA